jgi:hypothetical protein
MSFKILTEIFQCALERFDGAGRKGTKRIAWAKQFAVSFEILNITWFTGAFFERGQYFFEPGQTIAAGRAPAAGLASKELRQIMHESDWAGLVIEDDHRPGAQAAAGLHDRIEIHLDIKMFRYKEIR